MQVPEVHSCVSRANQTSLYPVINIGFLYLDQLEVVYVHCALNPQQTLVCPPANFLIYRGEITQRGLDYHACVRNALMSMGPKGFPVLPVFQRNLSKILLPLHIFSDQNTTFTRLLFGLLTNIYQTAAKSLVSSHRNQC